MATDSIIPGASHRQTPPSRTLPRNGSRTLPRNGSRTLPRNGSRTLPRNGSRATAPAQRLPRRSPASPHATHHDLAA